MVNPNDMGEKENCYHSKKRVNGLSIKRQCMKAHLYIPFSFKIITLIFLAHRFTLLVTYNKFFFPTRSIKV